VLLDGEPVKSCTMLAVQVAGRKLTTVEGLGQGAALDPIQVGFHEEHGLQCGFCTPGMLLVGASLLARNPNPTESEIRWAISGNICRSRWRRRKSPSAPDRPSRREANRWPL
jgi:carbon-monoxide dehydrogenase small subunit